jgi:antitoxin PrlF
MPTKREKDGRAKDGGACCGPECCGGADCCLPAAEGCCQVEAVIAVDARGQTVLPKEVRQKLGLRPNDKLAVMTWTKGEKACCVALVPVSDLAASLRQAYGPILKEISGP